MAAYPNNGRVVIAGHHVKWHNLELVETRNLSYFIEFSSGSGPFFGMDWQSVRCYIPISYWTTDNGRWTSDNAF